MIKIDGRTYRIPVLDLVRKGEFLDKYAKRTEDGVLRRELIGVYYNYQLKLGSSLDTEEYARLWDKLTEPEEFHTVTVPGDDGDYTFVAYFAGVGDKLRMVQQGENYWDGLTVNFIAQSPARS